ncbi:MAG: F420-dependent NADP oxidoreductase [Chitinophagales bacterium]|jgi:predicted short-subunit dehydrogenase-like oxidoreductase (DUF2520 family)|nr:F420-dependent NADP oxidoreductase [Chitinophagales bacterium]
MESKKIVIIGSGNVAHHLVRKVTSSNHKLLQIYNRSHDSMGSYAEYVDKTSDVYSLSRQADIYIICVRDNAVEAVAKSLSLNGKLVLHTSGSLSIDVLSTASDRFGVLFPIQSFNKNIQVTQTEIPIIYEGNTSEVCQEIKLFAQSISKKTYALSYEDRQKINLAGVLVNNFSNFLFTLASDFLKASDIDFSILHPLIQNTVDKLKLDAPQNLQTGPAFRHDFETMEHHVNMLKSHDNKLIGEIYQLFSEAIMLRYPKENNISKK